jgi:hypothetical protein
MSVIDLISYGCPLLAGAWLFFDWLSGEGDLRPYAMKISAIIAGIVIYFTFTHR